MMDFYGLGPIYLWLTNATSLEYDRRTSNNRKEQSSRAYVERLLTISESNFYIIVAEWACSRDHGDRTSVCIRTIRCA